MDTTLLQVLLRWACENSTSQRARCLIRCLLEASASTRSLVLAAQPKVSFEFKEAYQGTLICKWLDKYHGIVGSLKIAPAPQEVVNEEGVDDYSLQREYKAK